MDSYEHFEREIYPKLWHLAYDAGVEARENGLPRICNLEGSPHCHNGKALKPYKSAWEQGWDNWKIPEIFTQMETSLDQMPLRPCETRDL